MPSTQTPRSRRRPAAPPAISKPLPPSSPLHGPASLPGEAPSRRHSPPRPLPVFERQNCPSSPPPNPFLTASNNADEISRNLRESSLCFSPLSLSRLLPPPTRLCFSATPDYEARSALPNRPRLLLLTVDESIARFLQPAERRWQSITAAGESEVAPRRRAHSLQQKIETGELCSAVLEGGK